MMRGRQVQQLGQRLGQCDPWERLLLAVLAQAAKDLRRHSKPGVQYAALAWLNSDEVRELAKAFGINIPGVQHLRGVKRTTGNR